ncbi:MAG: TPM domain-containing protein [Treponema sp.]|nr:TPM domain-containing protein [Treponema sp.]
MKYKALIKKLSLDDADLEKIKTAVQKAESKTSGEIALAIAAESSCYAFWELAAALGTSLLLLVCLFPLAPQIYTWLGRMFWGEEPWYLAAFFLALCAAMVLLLYAAYNIPAIDRLVIPRVARQQAVTARALRYFAQSGVYATENRSGVLIFVSYFEREVRILADTGLNQKISPDLWNLVSDEISDSFAKGNVAEAFITAVQRCGDLLAENFPAHGAKSNELPDGLVVLENDRWI